MFLFMCDRVGVAKIISILFYLHFLLLKNINHSFAISTLQLRNNIGIIAIISSCFIGVT